MNGAHLKLAFMYRKMTNMAYKYSGIQTAKKLNSSGSREIMI